MSGRTRPAGRVADVAPPAVAAPEEAMLRAAARQIAVRFAAAAVVLLAVVGGVLFTVDRHYARTDSEASLDQAAARAEDVDDPPAGVALVLRGADGRVQASEDAPSEAAGGSLLDRPVGRSTWSDGARQYRVVTLARPGGAVVQALDDTSREREEGRRLLTALLVAGALGTVAAAAVGAVLARRAIRPLSDTLALQRRFVADASHELRAPLTVLHTRAQLLDRAARSGAPVTAEATAALVHDTRVLGDVVDDLLMAAELPHHPAAQEVVDLSAVAVEVVQDMTATADERGARVLASTPAPVVVRGAPTALRRAVVALVDNALAHGGAGVTVMVATGVVVQGRTSWARLCVADTGPGIDPDQVEAMFTRFSSRGAQGPRRSFGLGLALVRDVVVAHGGRVGVGGAPGRGAELVVLLPLAEGAGGTTG